MTLQKGKEMKNEKFIPAEKLSKKKRKELNAMKRGSWGGMNPVTRKPEKPGSYNRAKMKKVCREEHESLWTFCFG